MRLEANSEAEKVEGEEMRIVVRGPTMTVGQGADAATSMERGTEAFPDIVMMGDGRSAPMDTIRVNGANVVAVVIALRNAGVGHTARHIGNLEETGARSRSTQTTAVMGGLKIRLGDLEKIGDVVDDQHLQTANGPALTQSETARDSPRKHTASAIPQLSCKITS